MKNVLNQNENKKICKLINENNKKGKKKKS